MAVIRSQEELKLADLFASTLQNLLALIKPEEARSYPAAGQIMSAADADVCVSPALFRLVQHVLLPDVMGAAAGPVLYLAAKRFSGSLELRSIQDLREWFVEMKMGELDVELDPERVLVKLSHCLTCYRLPVVGSPLCDFERGLIDGVLESITGTEVVTRETLCWGLGDTVCQFEGYLSEQGGYLYAENGYHPEVQRKLLAGIASQSEVALENLQLISERHAKETRDPLTGMYNYRHMREHAALELARARRYERQVAFVMLDLDSFAAVNEAAGETAGDEVLRRWAAVLRQYLRTCDLTCRYGADEFLLVLPETADQQADTAVERILGAMNETEIEVAGRSFTVTATVGIAAFPEDGGMVEELVAKATTTMYVAKAKGPGSVAFYSPPAS